MCHSYHNPGLHTQDWGMFINPLFIGFKFPFFQESLLMAGWPLLPQKHHLGWPRRNKSVEQCSKTPDWWDNRFLYPIPWRIHGAGIYIYMVWHGSHQYTPVMLPNIAARWISRWDGDTSRISSQPPGWLNVADPGRWGRRFGLGFSGLSEIPRTWTAIDVEV
jgi:hypothetical protein